MCKNSKDKPPICCNNIDIKVINELLQSVIWVVFNVLASITPFQSPGGARPQYLNNWLSPIFKVSTFNNSIPALDRDTRVLCRNQHGMHTDTSSFVKVPAATFLPPV